MSRSTLEHRDPAKLKPHPLSRQIYGEDLDERFVASVLKAGILMPLVILRDDTIISGRRRREVAAQQRGRLGGLCPTRESGTLSP